ncbi:hypothetical protein ALC57_07137 [Trachymyrmex cornetzi]|uniref:Uncharacterized protein n=1 Tax=Trachymyrmex cornetzi TaxID=471704 RepID=A0A151J7Y4_9HYME|nr:hypothetical protein ALC57_07137 [Trachymyrmex cornetzi]
MKTKTKIGMGLKTKKKRSSTAARRSRIIGRRGGGSRQGRCCAASRHGSGSTKDSGEGRTNKHFLVVFFSKYITHLFLQVTSCIDLRSHFTYRTRVAIYVW